PADSPASPFITPQPPRSTLFPYTTLSDLSAPAISTKRCFIGGSVSRESRAAQRHGGELDRAAQLAALTDARDRPSLGIRAFELRDRKSTRLNSSHVKISYAVFCLKKKTMT